MSPLRIFVPAILIQDGQTAIPAIGDRVEYLLLFAPTTSAAIPDSVQTVAARVVWHIEPSGPAPSGDPNDTATYSTGAALLEGSGWRAYARSPVSTDSAGEVTGVFSADIGGVVPDEARVAGIVTACQLVTGTSWPDAAGRYSHDGTIELGPLRDGQKGFDSGLVADVPDNFEGSGWFSMVPPREGPWVNEEGLLVTLDV